MANSSGLSGDNLVVAYWKLNNRDPISTSNFTNVAVLSGTLDSKQYRDYSPAIELPLKLSSAVSDATAGKWVKFRLQFRKPTAAFPDITNRYAWYLGLDGTQLEKIRIPSPSGVGLKIPELVELDATEDAEWMRYPASASGAPTANSGLISRAGTKVAAIDLATARTYHAALTVQGAWSTAADATLSAANFSSVASDTVCQPSASSTGWPPGVADSGSLSIGAKTTIGSTVWGICVIRDSGNHVETYVKNGGSAWYLWESGDDIVAGWSQTPRGKIRLVDPWAGTIGKRNSDSTQEAQWFLQSTGNPKTQTRTPAGLGRWEAADPDEARGNAPGGTYDAQFSSSGVTYGGSFYYSAPDRSLLVYARAGEDHPWLDAALRKGANIAVVNSSTSEVVIHGTVSADATWSGSKATAILSTHNLLVSTSPDITQTYNLVANGQWLTWDDYATAPLPLSTSLFTTSIGDVHRYQTGLSDSPDSGKRGLVWRVGESNLVVYDEDNVQWTNAHVPITTYGNWTSPSALTAQTNIDTQTTLGIYRATSASTGTKPENAWGDFYFVVDGVGEWTYQFAWVKLVNSSDYGSYSQVTGIAFTSAGHVVVTGTGTGRVVDIFPNSGHTDLAGKLVVGNSLRVVHTTTPTDWIEGDITAVSDNPRSVSGSKRVTLSNVSSGGELAIGDPLRLTTRVSSGLHFRARQVVESGGSYTFAGVPWSYSVVDLRLYFGTTNLSQESMVGRRRAFEAGVSNAPSGQTAKPGIMAFLPASGTQVVAFADPTTYANDPQTFALRSRTYNTVHQFLQANWHNVPGIDTTNTGYDFVLSRELVTGQHPGPGQLSLDRSTNTVVCNIEEKIGTTLIPSAALSRIVETTVIHLEEPANGWSWTGQVDSVTRIGALGIFPCTLLEDRGSEHFFLNSEIKLFAQGYGTGEMPVVTNLDTVTDALRGQWVQFQSNATGRPWDEDGMMWIGSEHGGPFYIKRQRAFSTESVRQAVRSETLTLTAWGTAAGATDIIVGASDLNLNNAALDSLTSVPSTATNKPGSVAGMVYTRQRDDGTRSQVFVAGSAISHRTTTTAAPTTYGTWSNSEPADTIMDRIPNETGGFKDARTPVEWHWFRKTSTLDDSPSGMAANDYGLTRILHGITDRSFTVDAYYVSSGAVQKVIRDATEAWGDWDLSTHELPVIVLPSEQTVTGSEEWQIGQITTTMLPGVDYMLTYWIHAAGTADEDNDRTTVMRVREGSSLTSTIRATKTFNVPKENTGYHDRNFRLEWRDQGINRTTVVTRTFTCSVNMHAAGELAGGNWSVQGYLRLEPSH